MATYDDILTGGGLPMGGVGRRPLVDFRTYANPEVNVAHISGTSSGSTSTTPTSATTATSSSTPSAPATSTDTPEKKLSYVEMYQKLNPYTPPTPEDVEKEKRMQKQKQIFAAIGDGISALSNIYFTSQYAPDMWDAENSMSKKTRERWDALQKERKENDRTYMEGYLRAMAMDEAAEGAERNWRHALEREKIEDDYRERAMIITEAKAERDEKMAELKEQRLLGQITEQEYRNQVKEAEAKYRGSYHST